MSIQDARIAVLEARMSSEMADLIRRNGGTAWSVPAVREATLDATEPVATFIDRLSAGEIQIVVFFTGVGVNALLQTAEALERKEELLNLLRSVAVVCRGPKPGAVLRRNNIPIAASAPEPFTTQELIEALSMFVVEGKTLGVVHYGERNVQLAQVLAARGAHLEELCLYEWRLPDDIAPLRELVNELLDGHVDAVLFTSQIQIRHLFQVAREQEKADPLVEALQRKTIVASVGPTCTAVLQEYGVTPHVVPEHPKMGHLVKALVQYMHR